MVEISDDEYFLSLVEAAEAKALGGDSKRRRTTTSESTGGVNAEIEGPYTAALRGSRSSLWQQQQQQQQQQQRQQQQRRPQGGAREVEGGRSVGGRHAAGDDGEDGLPVKACPCGLGSCLVLTSTTAKNPGRKFYRCPAREENGGCNFFEWCDRPLSGGAPIHLSNSLFPDLSCSCGAGSCLVLTAKTGKNMGQQYYRCPAGQGIGSCGFFKWCNQHNSEASQPASDTPYFKNKSNMSCQPPGESTSTCFKCQQEGHWARDCSMPSSDSYAAGGNSASSAACFKCQKVGHWAKDCTGQDPIPKADSYAAGGDSASSGVCFKCQKSGHWARDCTAQNPIPNAGKKKVSYSCR